MASQDIGMIVTYYMKSSIHVRENLPHIDSSTHIQSSTKHGHQINEIQISSVEKMLT